MVYIIMLSCVCHGVYNYVVLCVSWCVLVVLCVSWCLLVVLCVSWCILVVLCVSWCILVCVILYLSAFVYLLVCACILIGFCVNVLVDLLVGCFMVSLCWRCDKCILLLFFIIILRGCRARDLLDQWQ